jgi:hypothetical protein
MIDYVFSCILTLQLIQDNTIIFYISIMSSFLKNTLSLFLVIGILIILFFIIGKKQAQSPIIEDVLQQAINEAQEVERLRREQEAVLEQEILEIPSETEYQEIAENTEI